MGGRRGKSRQKGSVSGNGSIPLLLTPQLVSWMNEEALTFAEASALYEQGKLQAPNEVVNESVPQETNTVEHFAFSAFQISPEPTALPLPNLDQG